MEKLNCKWVSCIVCRTWLLCYDHQREPCEGLCSLHTPDAIDKYMICPDNPATLYLAVHQYASYGICLEDVCAGMQYSSASTAVMRAHVSICNSPGVNVSPQSSTMGPDAVQAAQEQLLTSLGATDPAVELTKLCGDKRAWEVAQSENGPGHQRQYAATVLVGGEEVASATGGQRKRVCRVATALAVLEMRKRNTAAGGTPFDVAPLRATEPSAPSLTPSAAASRSVDASSRAGNAPPAPSVSTYRHVMSPYCHMEELNIDMCNYQASGPLIRTHAELMSSDPQQHSQCHTAHQRPVTVGVPKIPKKTGPSRSARGARELDHDVTMESDDDDVVEIDPPLSGCTEPGGNATAVSVAAGIDVCNEDSIRRILVTARNRPENVWCVDCRARLSEFVCGVLGVFTCSQCVLAHQKLRLGTPGLLWKEVEKKPETRRLQPPKSFGDVLKRGCRQFTSDELAGFGVRDLDFDCHIFLGNKYLVPVPSDTRITHVTKGSLDGWTVQSAQWMASRGNKISNEYYLANRNADTSPVPSRLTTPEGLFHFAQTKYERETWSRSVRSSSLDGNNETLACATVACAAQVTFMREVGKAVSRRISVATDVLKRSTPGEPQHVRATRLREQAEKLLARVKTRTSETSRDGCNAVTDAVWAAGKPTQVLRPLVLSDPKSTFGSGRLCFGPGWLAANGAKHVELTQARRRARLLRVRRVPVRNVWEVRRDRCRFKRPRGAARLNQVRDWFKPTLARRIVHFEAPEIGAILCVMRDGKRYSNMRAVLKKYRPRQLVGLGRGATHGELAAELKKSTAGIRRGWVYALPIKTIWPLRCGQSLVNLARAMLFVGHGGGRDALVPSPGDVEEYVNRRLPRALASPLSGTQSK